MLYHVFPLLKIPTGKYRFEFENRGGGGGIFKTEEVAVVSRHSVEFIIYILHIKTIISILFIAEEYSFETFVHHYHHRIRIRLVKIHTKSFCKNYN